MASDMGHLTLRYGDLEVTGLFFNNFRNPDLRSAVLVITEEQYQLTLCFDKCVEIMILSPDKIYFEGWRDKNVWTIPIQQELFGRMLREIMSMQDLFL